VDIDRGKIRLGIEAPRDVPILRQELVEAGATAPPAPVVQPKPPTVVKPPTYGPTPFRGKRAIG
jgi:carbon storage regulator